MEVCPVLTLTTAKLKSRFPEIQKVAPKFTSILRTHPYPFLMQAVSAIDFSLRLREGFCYFNAHYFCVE